MLCYVMLCYVMLCYVMYVMLCYVMLHGVTEHNDFGSFLAICLHHFNNPIQLL